MRFLRFLMVITTFALLILNSCSKKEKDNNGLGPGEGLSIKVQLIEYNTAVGSMNFELSDMKTVDFDGQKAIPLADFVPLELILMYDNGTPEDPSDDIDRRSLYAYRIIASDGYSVHDAKGYPDQRWTELEQGYILQETARAEFDPSLALENAYRVRDVATIDIYRKVEIWTPDDTMFVELADFTPTTFEGEPALELGDLLALIDAPEGYQYNIVAVDDFKGRSPFTWEEIQTGYWLLDSNRMQFDPDLGGKSRIKDVKDIEVVAP